MEVPGYFTVTGQRLGSHTQIKARQSQIDDLNIIAKIWKDDLAKSLWQNRNDNQDDSANDFALACRVIELGITKPENIERILRVSCLERPKWKSKRGNTTWIDYTIQNALKETKSRTNSESFDLVQSDEEPAPIDWAAFAATDHNIGDWLSEPLLPRGTLAMVYSAPGIGKSLLSLELAVKISLGHEFLAKSSGDPLSVVYLDFEMTEGDLADRLASLNIDPSELVNLHYYVMPNISALDTNQGGAEVRSICEKHKADLIVIDPLVNALAGDENESNTIKDWVRHTILPLKSGGVTVLVLDHSGKDRKLGMRGTSAKKATADVVWRMVGTGKGARLKADKRRQGWIPEVINLVKLEEPYLSHALITNKGDANVIDAVADEVVAELNDLDIPLDTSYAKAGKLLRAAGKRHSQKAVVAAQKKRRDPNSSNKIDFEDSVAEFCRDVVLKDEEYRCSTRDVHDYYRSWAADQNYEVMDLQDFANVVKRSTPGVRRRKNSNNINEWRGLKTPLLTRS